MDLSLTSVLALFILLVVASGAFFLAKKIRLPYTVFLVLIGLLVVPLANVPGISAVFGFVQDVQLTPELLFYIFLPMLIFESGYSMSVRRMLDSLWTITLLSVLGLLISAFAIAGLLMLALPLVGVHVPFIVALLFGAIISATDPVAVLALFKEFGAPKRLTMIFEGESLFNDGTAVALFLVVMGIITNGFHGTSTVLAGIGSFTFMVAAGIAIGLGAGAAFSWVLRSVRTTGVITATLLLVSAHLVFIGCELINELANHGKALHVSSIIATTVSSLFIGNYARHMLPAELDNYVHKAVEHGGFIANSLVFVLSGLLFASTSIDLAHLWAPILVTMLVVMLARALSVVVITAPINRFIPSESTPGTWQLLLGWASLRGALAIIVAMLIPPTLTVPGWSLPYTVREFVLALVIGCILATLFLKAPTIPLLIKRWKLNSPAPLLMAHGVDVQLHQLLAEHNQLRAHQQVGLVPSAIYTKFQANLEEQIAHVMMLRQKISQEHGSEIFIQSLRLTGVYMEQAAVREMFTDGELDELVYRRIYAKLQQQHEKIQRKQELQGVGPHDFDRKDVFEQVVAFFRRLSAPKRTRDLSPTQRYQYYRTQMVLAQLVLSRIQQLREELGEQIYSPQAYQAFIRRYEGYQDRNRVKASEVLQAEPLQLRAYLTELAKRQLQASHKKALTTLHHLGLPEERLQLAPLGGDQPKPGQHSSTRAAS